MSLEDNAEQTKGQGEGFCKLPNQSDLSKSQTTGLMEP